MTETTNPATTARTEDVRFSRALEEFLAEFFTAERDVVSRISPAAPRLVDSIARLTAGGKRLRARLCYWGWRAAGGDPEDIEIVRAAAALELFQSAALIHDDILDRSDTRRGQPSVHREFERMHAEAGWRDDAAHFGVGAAVLTGDMSLSFAEQLFARASGSRPRDHERLARTIYDTMRTEVMVGQYLDVHDEMTPPPTDPEEQLTRAMTVVRYKSAKYSVEHPVAIGAALAGADQEFLAHSSSFALPVGEAFQLRDDILGVFGDPDTTGKPAGDDIREGKRTALVALCARGASEEETAWLNSILGRTDLTGSQIRRARDLMENSGALRHAEDLIASLVATADEYLATLPTHDVPRAGLRALVDAAVRRNR